MSAPFHTWRPELNTYLLQKPQKYTGVAGKLAAIALASAGVSVILSKITYGIVDGATVSAYPLDKELPKDKKGRVNIEYTFSPGEGTQPKAENVEYEEA